MIAGKRSWLLIGVTVAALLLGAAGLFVGLDAKKKTKSDAEISRGVSAEVTKQIAAQASAARVQAGIEAGKQAQSAVATQGRINQLNKQIKALKKTISTQSAINKQLALRLQQLTARVSALEKKK